MTNNDYLRPRARVAWLDTTCDYCGGPIHRGAPYIENSRVVAADETQFQVEHYAHCGRCGGDAA